MNDQEFFQIFNDYFDLEKDAGKQHDMENYTLDRMHPVARLCGNPESRLKIVHVAGTKGKGSTSHYIANLLHSAGCSVGLLTSPHLTTVRERFEINGAPVSFDRLVPTATALCNALRAADLHPSLFEIFTLLALRIFADANVEYAILETGIGGLVDATNYVPKKLCSVITSISFDHTALLGRTIEEIAGQKAGIINSNTPVVIGRQPFAAADAVLTNKANELNCPIIRPTPVADGDEFIGENVPPYLQENFETAWATVGLLGIVPKADKFRIPELPARCQCISQTPLVVLDAAHNQDSARRLAEAIALLYPNTHFTVVLGIVAGKDVSGIVAELKQLNAHFILTNPDTTKGSALDILRKEAIAQNLPVLDIIEKIDDASQLPQNTPLLFTGSFFTCSIGTRIWTVDREK